MSGAGRGARVLFLGAPDRLEPWYRDVVEAVTPRHEIALYDFTAPLAPQFEDIDVVVDQGGAVGTREMVDAAKAAGARAWIVLGTGLDHVDVEYVVGAGFETAYTPGPYSAPSLAEHAMFLMLCFAKNFVECQAKIQGGTFYQPMNHDLEGKVLGIVGLGSSGSELAVRARAFGMRVVAVDLMAVPQARLDEFGISWFGDPGQLGGLLEESDYVSLHLHLTAETRNLVDAAAIERMKPGAVLVNVARGALVDEVALVDALRRGHLRGAGLDVFEDEPLEPGCDLLTLPNVVATPHVAGMTYGTSRRRAASVAENIDRWAAGRPMQHLVSELDWLLRARAVSGGTTV